MRLTIICCYDYLSSQWMLDFTPEYGTCFSFNSAFDDDLVVNGSFREKQTSFVTGRHYGELYRFIFEINHILGYRKTNNSFHLVRIFITSIYSQWHAQLVKIAD